MAIEQKEVDEIIEFIESDLKQIDSEKWFNLTKKKFPESDDSLITEIIMILSGGDVVEVE